jgi:hypothetical protein
MFLTLRQTEDYPLVTIGDAAASFRRRPDHATVGMSVAHRDQIITESALLHLSRRNGQGQRRPRTMAWQSLPQRYGSTVRDEKGRLSRSPLLIAL